MTETNNTGQVVALATKNADDAYTSWAKEVGAPFGGQPLEFANMQLWDKAPPEQGWAVFGHIPLAAVTGFYGEGAIGKSTAALQLAAACVTGQKWFGLPVKKGPAFFFNAEDDETQLHRVMNAVAASSLHSPPYLEKLGLHVVSYVGRVMMLARVEDGRMIPTELYYRLWHRAYEVRPVVIVLDPLNDIFPGDENNRAQVTEFMGLLRQIAVHSGAAVIVNAHPSKDGSNSGAGTSGSTAWHGKVRARLLLRQDKDDPDTRILEFKKNQYAKPGDSIRLRFEDGIFHTDVPLDDGDVLPAADEQAEELFLSLLDRFDQAGRNVCDKPGGSYAPARFAGEPETKAARLNKKMLGAAMSRLFAAGRIRVITEGPKSKQRSRIVRVEKF
ncbi:AAA family ATPase [Bradyrhizobium tunisiense]|uniref:AAA family ATPase n=1 Tax=Bradyrhizobium tunisiense TaxID=3278709 RepID=UPI0035DF2F92